MCVFFGSSLDGDLDYAWFKEVIDAENLEDSCFPIACWNEDFVVKRRMCERQYLCAFFADLSIYIHTSEDLFVCFSS